MNAGIAYQIPQHVVQDEQSDHKSDLLEEIPRDVLTGLSRQVGFLRAEHPERIPIYRQQLIEMIDELRRRGQGTETRRVSAFLALLVIWAYAVDLNYG